MSFTSEHSSEQGQSATSIGRFNFPLFLLSFAFLVVVLFYNAYNLWQFSQQRFNESAERTVNNYAEQAGLLAKAGLHANNIFTRTYGPQLLQFAEQPTLANQEQLWDNMTAAFFNLTGFFIFDGDGEYLRHHGQLLSQFEIADAESQIQQLGLQTGIFSVRYGSRGGYYIYSRFEINGKPMILATRRSYSKHSDIVYRGNFPGFELIILDRRQDRVSIREFYYANSSAQPALTQEEQGQIISRAELEYTPWDVIALPEEKERDALLWQYLRQPLLVMVVFTVLTLLLWSILRRNEMKARQQETIRRETEKRADKALMSIDEALISTDDRGRINYVNPKAAAIIRENGREDFLNKPLPQVWTDPDALWNRIPDIKQIRNTTEETPPISGLFNAEQRLFAQSYHPLYNGQNTEGVVWLLQDITEQLAATQAVSESRARYKALFQEAGVAHCLLDLSEYDGDISNLRLVDANEAAVLLAQSRNRETLLEKFQQLITPAHVEFHQAIERARKLNLATTEFEIEMTTFAGNKADLWVNLSLRSGSDGMALMTLVDITERNRIAQQTRERESFWGKIMQAMPDLVYVVEPRGSNKPHLIFRNRALPELLGYQHNPNSADDWTQLVDPADAANLQQQLAKISDLEEGQTAEFRGRFIHADNTSHVINFIYTAFSRNKQGEVQSIVGTARDVTGDIKRQERIAESERRYRLLAENMTDIIWATDTQLNFNFVSSSVERLLGYSQDELLNDGVLKLFKHRDMRRLQHALQQHINRAKTQPENKAQHAVIRQDIAVRSKAGKEILLDIEASLLWNENGELQGISGISRDVTEARQLENQLQLAAEVFENSNEAILITDKLMNIASTNKAFNDITGFQPDQVIGHTPDFLISQDRHNVDFFEDIGESLILDGYWQGEIFYQCADDSVRTGWAGVSAIKDNNRDIQSLIIIMSDITERKAIEERIHKLAYFDPLTGLPNRSQLHEQLHQMVDQAQQQEKAVALLFIDLDRFKPINDSMGHPAGDQVLKEVARRLSQCIKKQDLVCRLGGDEFTVALGNQESSDKAADTAVKVGERILHALHQPFKLGQREVFISASIGISVFPNDGTSVIELLKSADLAMYHAKELGRDNVQFFNEKMNQKAVELLELENDLRQALSREELELYFQPQYLTDPVSAVGAETLLRWNHPDKGMVSPAVFIPIIEDTGLIIPLGRWVLEQSCLKFAEWQKQGCQIKRIAVNVSARQFKQDDFIEMVRNAIAQAGIHPNQLELELTESILIDDLEHTLEVLTALKTLGVHTAIDDFGTGYSSLNYLKQFPVDTLKIDQSFIRNLPDNTDDAQITRTIIAMAHNLGLGVIAEGVETREQLQFLQQAQCEEVQGFFFSKPLPEKEFLKQISSDSAGCNGNN